MTSPQTSAQTWNSIRKHVCVLLTIVALVALAQLAAFAQNATGSLSGVITDATGAVVPNAKIEMKNELNGTVRDTVSNDAGIFNFAAVQPATYTVVVSAPGFASYTVKNVVFNQGENRKLNTVALKPAGTSESVEVVAVSETVPVETPESRMTLNSNMITQLGIQGRNASELIKFMPGMGMNTGFDNQPFTSLTTSTNSGPAGKLSASGNQPYGSMAITSDGANILDMGNQGTQVQNLNQDQIAEMTILNSSFGAEYAKGPVVVQAISKSGGNAFHGSGYFYTRNGVMNANDAWLKQNNIKKQEDSYYYPGGTLGGPVLIPGTGFNKNRDKLFFFTGFEYMKQNPAGNFHQLFIPTARNLAGDFSPAYMSSIGQRTWYPLTTPCADTGAWNYGNFCGTPEGSAIVGGIIPTSMIDPNSIAFAKYFPTPNQDPVTHGGYNWSMVESAPVNRWEFKVKGDYNLSQNTHINASYTAQNESDINNFGVWWWPNSTAPYPTNMNALTKSRVWSANVTHTFSPSMTNEFVFAYSYFTFPPAPANPAAMDPATNGFTAHGPFSYSKMLPQIPNTVSWGADTGSAQGLFPGFYGPNFTSDFGNAFGNQKYAPNISDNFTKVYKNHTFKMGFYWDLSWQKQSSGYGSWGQGMYNFDPWAYQSTNNVLADFVLGISAGYSQISETPIQDVRMRQVSFYGQDQWKVTRKLSLTLGVRMDHLGQWYPGGSHPGFAVWDPTTYNNASTAAPMSGLVWNALNKNVPISGWGSTWSPSPRVGASYDLFGNGKTMLRGGFGVYHWPVSIGDASGGYMAPLGIISVSSGGLRHWTDAASLAPPPASAFNGNMTILAKGDNKTPYTQNWNFIVGQQLPWKSLLEVQYTGNRTRDALLAGNGTNIPFYPNINKIPLGALYGPDPVTGTPCPSSASFTCDPRQWNDTARGHFKPYQNYGDALLVNTHGSYSNYNAFMVSWQKSTGRATFLTNYTFGKVLGTRDGQTNNGNGDGQIMDTFNIDNNYGVLAYDHTHIFNLAAVVKLPSAIKAGGNGLLAQVLNGWQLTPTIQMQSGVPIQPNTQGNLNVKFDPEPVTIKDAFGNDIPNPHLIPGYIRDAPDNRLIFGTNGQNMGPVLTCDPRSGVTNGQYFNPNCFTGPQVGGPYPNIIWPYIKGPMAKNFDLALYKEFKVTERQKVEFRVNSFNFLNHAISQFGLGNEDTTLRFYSQMDPVTKQYVYRRYGNATGIPFGKKGRRVLEFSLKYTF